MRAPIDPALLHELPQGHARLLRLRELGWGDPAIARALGVDVEALPILERVAVEKLAAARQSAAIE